MKEPFANLSDVITDTRALSDMELQSYLASLTTAQQAAFIQANVQSAVSSVNQLKAQRFSDSYSNLLGADNSITSSAYYLARTHDLNKLAGDINEVATKQVIASQMNLDVAGRQREINEWSNSNKLDTLFFLQVLFISLTFTGLLLFLVKNGLISMALFSMLVVILSILSILILIIRARYTSVVRDGRYWSKMRFPQDRSQFQAVAPPPTPPPKCK